MTLPKSLQEVGALPGTALLSAHTAPVSAGPEREESAAHPARLRPSRPARRARNYGSQKAVRAEEGKAEAAGRAPEATGLGVFPRWSVRLLPRS